MDLAWYPEKMSCPPELTSVNVPQGNLNQKQWVNALADRVVSLALKEPEPQKAANEACLRMSLANVDHPNQLGQVLVQDNLNLLTNLNVAAIEDPFPAKVESSDPVAEKALSETSLAQWVGLALSQVHESSLD
jgi:hypothetical protein